MDSNKWLDGLGVGVEHGIKEQLIQTMFKLKKLGMGFNSGMCAVENVFDINVTEYILMKNVEGNFSGSENNTELYGIREYLSISKPAVSQMLGVLEKKGYIDREVDKKNRRNLIVTLTPKGREALNYIECNFDDRLTKIISSFGEEETKETIIAIDRLINVVEQICTVGNDSIQSES